MKTYILLLISLLFLIACGSNESATIGQTEGNDLDLSIYDVRDVPGTNWKQVSRNHANGDVYEKGYIENGKKTGSWVMYYPDNGYIQSITHYKNGVLMGPYIEFDERGRFTKQIEYENNLISGLYGEYTNGRPDRKIQYYNGKINGWVREYDKRSNLIKEAYYRDNELDGKVSHFNEDGKLILEYVYENGKKISGGVVE